MNLLRVATQGEAEAMRMPRPKRAVAEQVEEQMKVQMALAELVQRREVRTMSLTAVVAMLWNAARDLFFVRFPQDWCRKLHWLKL